MQKIHYSRLENSHKTLCNKCENGGTKHVDIYSRIISLQCSWLQKPYDEYFPEQKIILPQLIIKCFRKSLIRKIIIYASPLMAIYLLNFPNLTETLCFNEVALCLLLTNYLFIFYRIFYVSIDMF